MVRSWELKGLNLSRIIEFFLSLLGIGQQQCLLHAQQLKPVWQFLFCFSSGGTIDNLIDERKGEPLPIIPEIDILHYVVDALAALKFIHEKGIVHGDIHGNVWAILHFLFYMLI